MPQVDLEALVCGGGGDAAKVSCETLATGGDAASTATEDPNLPAESFQLRIGDEIGWTDINAVYDRDDSTKGNTNPKSQQHHGGHSKPSKSISQRFSGNLAPKAPIIGLPNKVQHSGYLGNSRRLPKGRAFLKNRRGGGGRKAAVPPESDPGSPKVSFFGKVLSERERCRRQRDESGGCWAGIMALLRCGGGCRTAAAAAADEPVERKPIVSPVVNTAAAKTEEAPAAKTEEAPAAAPGLGGMKQFASRRRTASWGGDAEESGTLDGEEWARRSVGSLEDYRGRDW